MTNPPQNAVPPFRILGINNSNPRHAGNPPPKTAAAAADTGAGQLPPIPVTNPSLRAGWCGGEGGEGSTGNKGSGSTKKRTEFMGDGAHAPLDPDKTLPPWPMADIDDDSVFADSLWTPWDKAESEGEEETAAAAPAAKKRHMSNPYHPGCCSTLLFSSLCHQYPKDLPQGNTSHQGVAAQNSQEEGDRWGVSDIWSGRHQWQPLVWCTDFHFLARSSQEGCNAGAQHGT